VLQDPPVQLGDDLFRILVGARARLDEQRRRLSQRDGAGRIAAQILHHRRSHQLHRDRHLVDLVLAQQLAHHAPRQHAILAQRAPDLGQVVGGGRRRGRRRLAAGVGPVAASLPRFLAAVAAPERQDAEAEQKRARQHAERDGQPHRDAPRTRRLGRRLRRRRGRCGRRRGGGLRRHLRHRRIAEGDLRRRRRLRARRRERDQRLLDVDRDRDALQAVLNQIFEILPERDGQLRIDGQRHLRLLGDELAAPGARLLETGGGPGRQRGRARHPDVDVLQLGLARRHLFQQRVDPALDVLAHLRLEHRGVHAVGGPPLGPRRRRGQHAHRDRQGRCKETGSSSTARHGTSPPLVCRRPLHLSEIVPQ
jgi:hypothetical protein